MDTKLISEVTNWMKTTDLAEFCYEKDGNCIEIKTQEALPEPAQFTCSLTAVTAPAVGIYHLAAKGKNLTLAEGQTVQEGDALGLVETVSKKHAVTAPVSGKLRKITAQEGAVVEFGLPLFFIEK
ncbi:MAG: acetyl-CoA carboxylase biotin carboxyl carrier protein subunit [Elusimicrobiaceae bacterium]|nr:acetyl-CoA carboxylase biotin carboxyl carrier protein subunit [Elusimicrobiaceae bacterium]